MNSLHCLIPVDGGDLSFLGQSQFASIRLRSVPLIMAAEELAWKVTFGEQSNEHPSLILVGKIGANSIETRSVNWLNQIFNARKMGSKIILDYTDNHLEFSSSMTDFYKSVMEVVDACVVPSRYMATLLSGKWGGPISIIEDPIEVKESSPKANAGNPVTILWFGHSSNIEFLIKFLSTGFNHDDHIRLIVLSNDAGLNHFASSNLVSSAKIEFNLALWSLGNMVEASKLADMCIIPSDLNNPKKMGASSNRLITALTLGLPTSADNLPSYKEFEGCYCDLRSNDFREMLDDPSKFSHSVSEAQAELSFRFSKTKIQSDWKNFLLAQII